MPERVHLLARAESRPELPTSEEPAPTSARSALMAKVRSVNTKPELAVRRALHAAGRRFLLHRRDLPGCPDIVLPRHRLAIFVHGCFWHRHPNCRHASTPKTRAAYWGDKFATNIARDRLNEARLKELGWTVATIWECETRNPSRLNDLLAALFDRSNRVRTDKP